VIPRRRSGGAPARMRGVVEEQEATRYVVEQTFGIFDRVRKNIFFFCKRNTINGYCGMADGLQFYLLPVLGRC
jgi:hypothetical protein